MDNVYALVEQFYQKNKWAGDILPRNIVEKYLRRQAWHGKQDADLKEIWGMLAQLLSYANELNLESLALLTPYDYQEIFYRYAQVNEKFQLNETCIQAFLSAMQDFFAFYAKWTPDDDWQWYLRMVKDALYENGKFYLPPRRKKDEFYSSLEHLDFVPQAKMEQLNRMLDDLLKRVDSFFRQPVYKFDLDRAISMYTGPDDAVLLDDNNNEDAQMMFWNGFWDFFLFDYHLSETDAVPLNYYYQQQKEKLSASEQDILRDLLRSQFTIFTIENAEEDFITCRNLLTDKEFDLPLPDVDLSMNIEHLFYGHVHSDGVMLLNYITSVPASPKLKRRIKETILRQYEGFKLQMPEATIEDFLGREAGAVRHTLQIMSGFAQLSVLPVRDKKEALPEPKLTDRNEIEAAEFLQDLARKAGFTAYETKLLGRLFADYLSASKRKFSVDKLYLVLTACLLKFSQLNGNDMSNYKQIYQMLGIDRKVIQRYMSDIGKCLHCVPYDPRYLTEYGFIQALYSESYK